MNPKFYESWRKTIAESGLDPDHLTDDVADDIIKKLKEMGLLEFYPCPMGEDVNGMICRCGTEHFKPSGKGDGFMQVINALPMTGKLKEIEMLEDEYQEKTGKDMKSVGGFGEKLE